MRPLLKQALDSPEISIRQSPIIWIQHSQVEHAITLDPSRVIDVTLRITESECARRFESRLAAVQSGIARARNRTPSGFVAIDEDHMIEKIDRLEPKYQRRISMLLESDSSEQCCLETMRSARAHDTTNSAHSVACRLAIVWKIIEPSLNNERRTQRVYQAPLDRRKRQCGGIDPGSIRESISHYCFLSSMVQTSLCLSPTVK